MPWKLLLILAACIALGGVVTLALLSLFSPGPRGLGERDGRLAPCPSTPNCVCSFDTDARHAIAPFTFDDPDEAWRRLQAVLRSWPRTRIAREDDHYLHAECRSLLFRFVDDVEFLLDREAKVVHVRSASRTGRSDLGVNRKRVEAMRAAFAGGAKGA